MDLFLLQPELLTALSVGTWALLVIAIGLLLYGYIADRVVFEDGGRLRIDKFGPVDALGASLLGCLLLLPVAGAVSSPAGPDHALPSASQMIVGTVASAVVEAVVVGGILGGLTARGIAWREVFGLDRQRPGVVLGLAVLLLVLAWPLVQGATIISQFALAAVGSMDDTSQELVRFLGSRASHTARLVIGLSAVFVAPPLEETIFRGYLYGVVRRYAGVAAGVVVNSLLFAAVHTHLPSFGGLFVLAVCLSLAYEWTGSIFVNMTMHALFNAISVAQLLSGGTSEASIHVH